MRRPIGIYLVSIWFFFLFIFETGPLSKIAKYYFNGKIMPELLFLVDVGILIFAIVVVTGLLLLHNLTRWFVIAFFAICSIMPIVNVIMRYTSLTNKIFHLLPLILVPNVFSIKYLLSQKIIKQSQEIKKEEELSDDPKAADSREERMRRRFTAREK